MYKLNQISLKQDRLVSFPDPQYGTRVVYCTEGLGTRLKTGLLKIYANSPTEQDTFWPITSLDGR